MIDLSLPIGNGPQLVEDVNPPFKIHLFYFMCMCVPECIYLYCSMCLKEPKVVRRGAWFPGNKIMSSCELWRCLGENFIPLQKKQVLLTTEPSFLLFNPSLILIVSYGCCSFTSIKEISVLL